MQFIYKTICLLVLLIQIQGVQAESRWGAEYFPNTKLITHEGKEVSFFDDLIKDKVVAINFIYTSCPDSCPLETAQLMKVQEILGDRLGKDVFIYSISIDPEVDTPAVLKDYRQRFGANWTFLTGDEKEITEIRRKLGLYIEEIQDGSLNHNVSMIIGNQKTGRWMKRSPFENPHILADQLGNWLSGWKSKQAERNYAEAPELRNIGRGEQMFRTRCQICHTITGNELDDAVGPDLLGVHDRRDLGWLLNWLRAPDQMLEAKDPIAMALYKKYNNVSMPNMRLNQHEAMDLLNYIKQETQRIEFAKNKQRLTKAFEETASDEPESAEDVVAVMNAWVREAVPNSIVNAGYFTLINTSDSDIILVGVDSNSFAEVEVHEMSMKDGMMKMARLESLTIPANGLVKLSPGGKHLMLKKPVADLKVGQQVDLSLKFKSGKSQNLSVKVRKQ